MRSTDIVGSDGRLVAILGKKIKTMCAAVCARDPHGPLHAPQNDATVGWDRIVGRDRGRQIPPFNHLVAFAETWGRGRRQISPQ